MNKSSPDVPWLTSEDTAEKFYPELFENSPTKLSIVSASIVLCLVNLYLTSGIMWYERFSSDNRRTLMNRLVALICLEMIKWILLCQTCDIVRWAMGMGSHHHHVTILVLDDKLDC